MEYNTLNLHKIVVITYITIPNYQIWYPNIYLGAMWPVIKIMSIQYAILHDTTDTHSTTIINIFMIPIYDRISLLTTYQTAWNCSRIHL